jgi:hypothetical protein
MIAAQVMGHIRGILVSAGRMIMADDDFSAARVVKQTLPRMAAIGRGTAVERHVLNVPYHRPLSQRASLLVGPKPRVNFHPGGSAKPT